MDGWYWKNGERWLRERGKNYRCLTLAPNLENRWMLEHIAECERAARAGKARPNVEIPQGILNPGLSCGLTLQMLATAHAENHRRNAAKIAEKARARRRYLADKYAGLFGGPFFTHYTWDKNIPFTVADLAAALPSNAGDITYKMVQDFILKTNARNWGVFQMETKPDTLLGFPYVVVDELPAPGWTIASSKLYMDSAVYKRVKSCVEKAVGVKVAREILEDAGYLKPLGAELGQLSQREYFRRFWRLGWLTPNEVRAKEGLSPLPETASEKGKYVPANWGLPGKMANEKRAQRIAENEQQPCTIPPPGWKCTRGKGHVNPCAAVPQTEQEARAAYEAHRKNCGLCLTARFCRKNADYLMYLANCSSTVPDIVWKNLGPVTKYWADEEGNIWKGKPGQWLLVLVRTPSSCPLPVEPVGYMTPLQEHDGVVVVPPRTYSAHFQNTNESPDTKHGRDNQPQPQYNTQTKTWLWVTLCCLLNLWAAGHIIWSLFHPGR